MEARWRLPLQLCYRLEKEKWQKKSVLEKQKYSQMSLAEPYFYGIAYLHFCYMDTPDCNRVWEDEYCIWEHC